MLKKLSELKQSIQDLEMPGLFFFYIFIFFVAVAVIQMLIDGFMIARYRYLEWMDELAESYNFKQDEIVEVSEEKKKEVEEKGKAFRRAIVQAENAKWQLKMDEARKARKKWLRQKEHEIEGRYYKNKILEKQEKEEKK